MAHATIPLCQSSGQIPTQTQLALGRSPKIWESVLILCNKELICYIEEAILFHDSMANMVKKDRFSIPGVAINTALIITAAPTTPSSVAFVKSLSSAIPHARTTSWPLARVKNLPAFRGCFNLSFMIWCLGFEMDSIGLMSDNERKMLCLLSVTKPILQISKPNNVESFTSYTWSLIVESIWITSFSGYKSCFTHSVSSGRQ